MSYKLNQLESSLIQLQSSQILLKSALIELESSPIELESSLFELQSSWNSLHEICVQVFLSFSYSSKPSQSVWLIYEMTWLAEIRKSGENLLKTSCKVAPVTKVANIFWRDI